MASRRKLPVYGPVYGGEDAGPRPSTRVEVARALGRGVDPVTVVEHVGVAVDRVQADVLGAANGEPVPACAAGCCHCCHQRVEVTVPEVARLARHLRELPGLAIRVEKTAKRTRGLSSEAYRREQIPCAFLDSRGLCAVYEQRPLGCRRAHSTDRGACEAAHRTPDAAPEIPAAPSLSWNTSAVVVGMLEGMKHAGLAPDHYELHHALAIALEHEHELPLAALDLARTRTSTELATILGQPAAPARPSRHRTTR